MNSYKSGTNDIQGVHWVSSIDEARYASVPFGRAMFMNSNVQEFYIKEAMSGSIRVFKFEEVEIPKPEDFVTKAEFEDLRRKYEQLVQQQQPTATATATESNVDTASNAIIQGDSSASQGAILQTNGKYGGNGISAE